MPSKIGVFCPTLNVYGGGEYVAVAMANALAQQNHQVTMFCARPVDSAAVKNFFGENLNPKIQTVTQPTNFKPWGIMGFYQNVAHSYIAKSKCSLFVDAFSNCVFPWSQVSYIHYPFLNREFYTKKFPYLKSPHLLQVGALPHVMVEKNLANYQGKLILANSQYTAKEIRKYQNKPVQVLYPPFSAWISQIGKTAAKNPQENLVVTTSRLEPNKLLERIPQIAAQTDRDINFAVIGRLNSKETLSHLQHLTNKMGLGSRVKFYPDASAEQKIDLLKRAKVYLHTMVGEHFGISIVEAMALGCIPIVHNSGGMVEIAPQKYRYETTAQAAQKINDAMGSWCVDDCVEVKGLSERFSEDSFAKNFLNYLSSFL
jgi:glycosyltransferase involved in cell wall biosynthesis